MRTNDRRRAGFSMLEIVIAVSILTIGFLAVFGMNVASVNQVAQTKQRSIARLATISAREALEAARFRRTSPTDTDWFLGATAPNAKFPIAWDATGAPFVMPNCTGLTLTTTTPTVTGAGAPSSGSANPYAAVVDGVGGCICVEFPVPPLKAPRGRINPGRITFYLSERSQPTNPPTTAFPFQATPGLTYLDCDGCHEPKASAASDLRLGDLTKAAPPTAPPVVATAPPCPFKLIPVKISVDWIPTTTNGANPTSVSESYTTYFLLSYRGYD